MSTTNLDALAVNTLGVGGQDIPAPTSHAYAAGGAIVETNGAVTLAKTVAGVISMTLAPPAAADNFKVLHILNAQAQANTITVTEGFAGGGGGMDVATMGAAIGNSLTVMAYNQHWYVIGAYGCTLA